MLQVQYHSDGRSAGHAVVIYETIEDAEASLASCNGYRLEGRAIEVTPLRLKKLPSKVSQGVAGMPAGIWSSCYLPLWMSRHGCSTALGPSQAIVVVVSAAVVYIVACLRRAVTASTRAPCGTGSIRWSGTSSYEVAFSSFRCLQQLTWCCVSAPTVAAGAPEEPHQAPACVGRRARPGLRGRLRHPTHDDGRPGLCQWHDGRTRPHGRQHDGTHGRCRPACWLCGHAWHGACHGTASWPAATGADSAAGHGAGKWHGAAATQGAGRVPSGPGPVLHLMQWLGQRPVSLSATLACWHGRSARGGPSLPCCFVGGFMQREMLVCWYTCTHTCADCSAPWVQSPERLMQQWWQRA